MNLSRRTRCILAAVATAILCVLLWMPPAPGPDVSHLDKLVHLLLFAGLTLAWRIASVGRVALVLTLCGLAGLTEWVQGLLPWPRTPDVLDVAADIAGIVLASLLPLQRNGWDSNPR